MSFQDVLILLGIVVLVAFGGKWVSGFGAWLANGISNNKGGGPGGPTPA